MLFDQVSEDIKQAMKARDALRLNALRAVKKEFLEARTAKDAGGAMDAEAELKLLQKMVKQRKDAADIFVSQGRVELADNELKEAEIIAAYLPAQMSSEELETGLKALISELGAQSMADMGKVMGEASRRFSGKADGKAISSLVRKLLV
ncbi:GatB/YqeY domain-containing protein [Geofilum rhodophaeum]|jgi:hypothetical protein|uniref:GatB/YqeY domain-containing protein n=1 Tax=Geofilum rhodophaeum TaxID=1965019 RepID=UPI000B5226D8|nr:GatB/YqeY domain-containing protein [Geofilum rhodophaeum]